MLHFNQQIKIFSDSPVRNWSKSCLPTAWIETTEDKPRVFAFIAVDLANSESLVTGSMESGADRQHGTEERWLLDRLIPKIHCIVVFLLTIQTMLLPILREIFSWFQSWTSSLLWTSYCHFLKLMFFRGMSTRRLRRTKERPKVQREIAMRSVLSYLRSDLQKN